MRRPTDPLRFALVLLILRADALSAQTAPTPPPPLAPRSVDTESEGVRQASGPSFSSRVETALGAALLGAGIGFFASQVAIGDWDEQEGNRRVNRGRWAEIGGAAAFTLGFSFPIGGRAGPVAEALPMPSDAGAGLPDGRARITTGEFVGSSGATAYDIVKSFRPEWLLRQLSTSETQIAVYLDSRLVGDPEALTDILAKDVSAIYRFTASQATIRWGVGHQEGAILVVTKH